jgi:predicted dehydrogenase
MLNIGVIGYGYWGPNIVRNFNGASGAQVKMVCDVNQQVLNKAKKIFPHIETTTDMEELLRSPDIDAVAIVTPVSTHYKIAQKALKRKKHIFIEKPFTFTSSEAEELIEMAESKDLKIMVDHTFLYTGAVRKIKQLVDENTLGKLLYFDSTRVNLGLFQHDINVLWDLACHDISIMLHIMKEWPSAVIATGTVHFKNDQENVAYLTFYFPSRMIAHINVNWLSPVKIRTTLIAGEKKMLVWNDIDPDEKIKIYDKGVNIESKEGQYKLLVDYRSGDIWVPKLEQTEALKRMAESFVDYVEHGTKIINDGYAGLQVVKLLQAANRSLKNMGETVKI